MKNFKLSNFLVDDNWILLITTCNGVQTYLMPRGPNVLFYLLLYLYFIGAQQATLIPDHLLKVYIPTYHYSFKTMHQIAISANLL